MKKMSLILLLTFLSTEVFSSELVWKSINVADPTQPTGVSTYVGSMSKSDFNSISKGQNLPKFVEISNLTIIEQTGSLKKVSDFPWGGGRFVMGNEIYVNVEKILSLQSINPEFAIELQGLHK